MSVWKFNSIFIFLMFSKTLGHSETVISIPASAASSTGNKMDGKLAYDVITPISSNGSAWKIDQIKIESLYAYSGWNPEADTFYIKIFSSIESGQFQQNGQEKVSSFTSQNIGNLFSVTFNFEDIFISAGSAFFYSIRSSSTIPLVYHSLYNVNYGNGWGTSGMTPINENGFITGMTYMGYSTPAISLNATLIPEPSALSLLAVGLGGLAMVRRGRS